MRYLHVEITDGHLQALGGQEVFHITVPERCEVRVVAVHGEAPEGDPVWALLPIVYRKLLRIYAALPPSERTNYLAAQARELLDGVL